MSVAEQNEGDIFPVGLIRVAEAKSTEYALLGFA